LPCMHNIFSHQKQQRQQQKGIEKKSNRSCSEKGKWT
jgi:hypothetical protein